MIGAIVQGELIADPVQRTASNGSPFVTATLRVPAGAEALFVGIAAFETEAADRLAKLCKGSTVAAAGTLEANEWMTREGETRKGWRLTAVEVLTAHQARKRRREESQGGAE